MGIRNWKLSWALLPVFMICGLTAAAGEGSPHTEPMQPETVTITLAVPSISGANVAAGLHSWNNPAVQI